MAFSAVQFADGGRIVLVNSKWLTPRKCEVFWPPIKTQSQFIRTLKSGTEAIDNTWKLYSISKLFFSSDDFDKSYENVKILEDTNITTEEEIMDLQNVRQRKRHRPLFDEDFGYKNGDNEVDFPPSPRVVAKARDTEHAETTRIQSQTFSPKSSVQSVSPSRTFLDDSETSCSEPASVAAFQIKILEALKFIQKQNSEIITLLKSSPLNSVKKIYSLPDDLSVNLPLKNIEDLNKFEQYLEDEHHLLDLVTYFSTLGGKGTAGQTNNILRRLITNKFAREYSFYGKRGEKRAFSGLRSKELVIGAIKLSSPEAKEKDIEDGIKVWLKHSPQRYKTELLKQYRRL